MIERKNSQVARWIVTSDNEDGGTVATITPQPSGFRGPALEVAVEWHTDPGSVWEPQEARDFGGALIEAANQVDPDGGTA